MSRWTHAGLACLALSLVACGQGDEPQPILVTRVAKAPRRPARAGVSSAERFGIRKPTGTQPARSAGTPTPSGPSLRWATPAGWQTKPKGSMRLASFQVGGDAAAECSLTVLGGAGGGLKANLDRWRGQFGQPDLSTDELAGLQTVRILGGAAPVLDLSGSYQGSAGQRLLGAVREFKGKAIFVKMTGPASVIEGEQERFKTFCESIR